MSKYKFTFSPSKNRQQLLGGFYLLSAVCTGFLPSVNNASIAITSVFIFSMSVLGVAKWLNPPINAYDVSRFTLAESGEFEVVLDNVLYGGRLDDRLAWCSGQFCYFSIVFDEAQPTSRWFNHLLQAVRSHGLIAESLDEAVRYRLQRVLVFRDSLSDTEFRRLSRVIRQLGGHQQKALNDT